MKLTLNHRTGTGLNRRDFKLTRPVNPRVTEGHVRRALAQIRNNVWTEFATSAGENARLLRLALNEAEALAWQTGHPHLFFPTLAVEKAQAVATWQQRQRALTGRKQEWSLAE